MGGRKDPLQSQAGWQEWGGGTVRVQHAQPLGLPVPFGKQRKWHIPWPPTGSCVSELAGRCCVWPFLSLCIAKECPPPLSPHRRSRGQEAVPGTQSRLSRGSLGGRGWRPGSQAACWEGAALPAHLPRLLSRLPWWPFREAEGASGQNGAGGCWVCLPAGALRVTGVGFFGFL